MSLKTSNLMWFILKIIELNKSAYPLSRIGARLITGATVVGMPITISAQFFIDPSITLPLIEWQMNAPSLVSSALSILTAVTGVLMIRKELTASARPTARLLINGLPGTSSDFPTGLLTKSEELKAREPIVLGASGESNQEIDRHIIQFNAELTVRIIERFVLHKDCQKVFVGGLARIPFLVAYGSMLRTQSAHICYFDKFHRNGKWQLLNAENDSIEFIGKDDTVKPNSNGQIGVAIAFSTEIQKESLPEYIKENTLILRSSTETDHNLIKSQENLEQLGSELKKIINKLSQTGAKEIHLFLSVQSTFAIEIGRQFQEGTGRPWVIHNFNGEKGVYEWAITLTKQGLQQYTP